MRELRRPRGDLWELAVWEDSLATDGCEVYLTMQVHNEAIVIPENIEAIRALAGREPYATRSIERTNNSLGVRKQYLPAIERVGTAVVTGACEREEVGAD